GEHENPQQGEEPKTQRCNRYFAHGLPPCLGCCIWGKPKHDGGPTGGNNITVMQIYSVCCLLPVDVKTIRGTQISGTDAISRNINLKMTTRHTRISHRDVGIR